MNKPEIPKSKAAEMLTGTKTSTPKPIHGAMTTKEHIASITAKVKFSSIPQILKS